MVVSVEQVCFEGGIVVFGGLFWHCLEFCWLLFRGFFEVYLKMISHSFLKTITCSSKCYIFDWYQSPNLRAMLNSINYAI